MDRPLGLRRVRRADFELIGTWLTRPHVHRWWHQSGTAEAVEAEFGAAVDGTDPTDLFLAVLDARPVGLIQRYRWHAYPDEVAEMTDVLAIPADAASVDYLIGDEEHTARGLGTAMIATMVERTWRDWPDVGSVIVPVHAENRPSWRALERAGFVRVATGELTPDNPADSRDHVIYRATRPAVFPPGS